MKNSPADCEPFKKRKLDAATAGLGTNARLEFTGHLQACASCREEFGRVQALLREIDRGARFPAGVAPSETMFQKVRQRIAEESAAAEKTRPVRWVTLAACAAMVLAVAGARLLGSRWGMATTAARPPRIAATYSSPKPPANPRQDKNKILEKPVPADSKPMLFAEIRNPRHHAIRKESGPEVLVPPGQMKELMKLVAILSKPDEHNAASVIQALRQSNVDKPLRIKPLVIPPLESTRAGSFSGQAGRESSN